MSNLLLFLRAGIADIMMLLFLFGLLLLWVNAILEIVMGTFRDSIDKVVWLLLVLMVPVFGVILYYLVGRRRRLAR